MSKSANKLWRESGTTLPFKEWLSREKEKFASFDGEAKEVIPNVPLNDSIQKTIADMRSGAASGADTGKGKTFGISNWVIIGAAVIVVGAIIYKQYQNRNA